MIWLGLGTKNTLYGKKTGNCHHVSLKISSIFTLKNVETHSQAAVTSHLFLKLHQHPPSPDTTVQDIRTKTSECELTRFVEMSLWYVAYDTHICECVSGRQKR